MKSKKTKFTFSGWYHPILFVFAYFLGGLGWTNPVLGAKFSNQFTEFELPPQWVCNLEGTEWVCQSQAENKKRDAVIVLAAKIKGPQDSLDQYLGYLKTAKSFTSTTGKSVTSEPRYAKTLKINNQDWVDALHLQSEIPGFYTRYLGTVKEDIGVLVTYSIDKEKYREYLPQFENMIQTLKVFRRPGGINTASGGGSIFSEIKIPVSISENTVFPAQNENTEKKPKPAKNDDDLILYLIVGIIVALLIIRLRKKRNQGGGF